MAKVLVIDECPDFLEWSVCHLLRNGFSVIEARDGLAGLQRAVEDAPDWVLIDADLSIQSGSEICRQLRQDEATRNLPIVIWSSRPDEAQEAAALAAGADLFLDRSRQTTDLAERGWDLLGARAPVWLLAGGVEAVRGWNQSHASFDLAVRAGRR